MMTQKKIADMIDISDLRTDTTYDDIERLISVAKEHGFVCAFALPCYLSRLLEAFKDTEILVGAAIGFPTGAEPTQIKMAQTRHSYELGCDEFDMVMNVGWLKSKEYRAVADDISAVRRIVADKPLKVIIESMYLSESEIVQASKIVRDCGADYIKTGTGWADKPTTFKHIEIMKRTLGNSIKIKAAGGVWDLDMLLKMHDMGVTRFGLGIDSAIKVIRQVNETIV